jgi:integrase
LSAAIKRGPDPASRRFRASKERSRINDDPAAELENSKVQVPEPDPFERHEVEQILADLGKFLIAAIRPMSGSALRAHMLTMDQTGWSILPPSFQHELVTRGYAPPSCRI